MKRIILFSLAVMMCASVLAANPVKVHRGTSTYYSDVICNVKDGNVYKGNSSFDSDVLCHIRDGKVYRGKSKYRDDVLATIIDGYVYMGNSTYTSDCMYTISGKLTVEEFVAVWYVYHYVY